MKVAFFNLNDFERPYYPKTSAYKFFEEKLTVQTATLAQGFSIVCCFVLDKLGKETLEILARQGTQLVALRSAGFNHVDLKAAAEFGIRVVRVPKYSPHAVAEHAVALILSLNRKTHRAYMRVKEQNFSLSGLEGFDLYKKTVGTIGTGNIGKVFARIMLGFGCKVLGYDPVQNQAAKASGIQYVSLEELYKHSDIISIHCPLTKDTAHLIDESALERMKDHVMLINTSRGKILDTKAVISALKTGKLGYLGLDVYEEEEELFFSDHSNDIITDDVFARLQSFPNVLITAHQGFFTHEALLSIAETTMQNIQEFSESKPLTNEVKFL